MIHTQTISMQNILIVFFVVSIILMILVFPFKTRCMGHFNLVEFVGFYSIKIMKMKLLNGMIGAKNGKIVVENSVNIINSKINQEYLKKLYKKLLRTIEVEKVEIFFTGGIANNSFSSAVICGGVSSVINLVYSYLTQKYFGVKLYEDVTTKFGENNIELTFDVVVSISFISLVFAMLSSLKKCWGE